jgi:hypothetical protein
MARPVDDHEAALGGQVVFDAVPRPRVDEKAVPEHRDRTSPQDANGERTESRLDGASLSANRIRRACRRLERWTPELIG